MHPFDGFQGIVQTDVPLAPLVWFRLGGPAAFYAKPHTLDELLAVLKQAREASIPVKILGGGSNVLVRETGTDDDLAAILVAIAQRSRNLQGHGLDEGASTRMLIHAGRMVRAGLPLEAAVQSSIVLPITDNPDIRAALTDAIQACLP